MTSHNDIVEELKKLDCIEYNLQAGSDWECNDASQDYDSFEKCLDTLANFIVEALQAKDKQTIELIEGKLPDILHEYHRILLTEGEKKPLQRRALKNRLTQELIDELSNNKEEKDE